MVLLERAKVVESRQTDTGYDPISQAKGLLKGLTFDRIMATGYGRNLFEIAFEAPTVTEIKAYAVGVKKIFPNARTILDIGGQDSKAISLTEDGKISKFEMNDRCAAGTGKFLEIMAGSLGYSLQDFGVEALKASKPIQINSMCTVFAESEITSLVAKGEDRRDIALGIHRSVVKRAVSMLKRVSVKEQVVFAGGVALNPCMVRLLEQSLELSVYVPPQPQMMGALGAALLACGDLGR